MIARSTQYTTTALRLLDRVLHAPRVFLMSEMHAVHSATATPECRAVADATVKVRSTARGKQTIREAAPAPTYCLGLFRRRMRAPFCAGLRSGAAIQRATPSLAARRPLTRLLLIFFRRQPTQPAWLGRRWPCSSLARRSSRIHGRPPLLVSEKSTFRPHTTGCATLTWPWPTTPGARRCSRLWGYVSRNLGTEVRTEADEPLAPSFSNAPLSPLVGAL